MKSNAESAPSSYPAPKTQELSLLARKIQQNDNVYVQDEIRKNPRLLSASTDAPTILQEGFRYNGLHVAARFGNAEAAQIILSTVNGTSYMTSLYPDDPQRIRQERTTFLTDMYLNTPDKGAFETPLHFASKFGFYEVVKLLLGHPLCDPSLKNRDQLTAQEIICSRASGSNATNKERIAKLFQETRIVPIWRDVTNDTAPVVGRPVNPKYLGHHTPKPFTSMYGDVALELFGPEEANCIPKGRLGIHWEIRAYAGPTDELTAAKFYETMKGTATVTYAPQYHDSPNGDASPDLRPLYNSGGVQTPTRGPFQPISNLPHRSAQRGTPTRGPVTSMLSTPEFRKSKDDSLSGLKTPKDQLSTSLLSPFEFRYTPQTLSLLLTSPIAFNSPGRVNPNRMLEDRQVRRRDPEKGVERVGQKHANELGISWNEFWSFLGEFANLSSETGLVLLEDLLYRGREEQLVEEEEMARNKSMAAEPTPVTAICREMQNLNLDSKSNVAEDHGRSTFSTDWRNGLVCPDRPKKSESRDSQSSPIRNPDPKIRNGDAGSSFIRGPPETPNFKLTVRKLFPCDEDEKSVNGHGDPKTPTGSREETSMATIDPNAKCVWRTPPSSFSSSDESGGDSEDEFEDCATYSLFINGSQARKEDFQAMHAISDVVENLSEVKYPQITAWYNCLKASGSRK